MNLRSSLACTLLCSITITSASAGVPAYTQFELQARSNLLVNDAGYNLPPGSSFNSISAAINDADEVSFPLQVVPDATSYHPGIWSGSHGVGAIVYDGPNESSISSDGALNAAGAIVFTLGDTNGADGLYVYDPDAGTATRLNTAPVIPNYYGSPAINVDGIVGYQAVFSSGRALASTGAGSSVFHVSDSGIDPDSAYTYLYTPSFNDRRHIAAKVATSPDQASQVELRIFASDGSSQRILANQATDAQSPYSKFDNSLALNNADVIAVVATRASDNRRVVLRSDGVSTNVIAAVDPAGTIRDIEFFAPSINDAGLVVFRARDANGEAIYVGDGKTLVRVIGNADVIATDLGGAQVGQDNDSDAIFSGRPTINNHGDIAFIAALYPEGDNQTEWGSGVFVAYAPADDGIFTDGFDG
jgi:hypothetical protein